MATVPPPGSQADVLQAIPDEVQEGAADDGRPALSCNRNFRSPISRASSKASMLTRWLLCHRFSVTRQDARDIECIAGVDGHQIRLC
jgi:hypothetical protein